MKAMEIHLSRHAKNKIRLYKLRLQEIEDAINQGEKTPQGNKWESKCGDLRIIWETIGSYMFVITVIKAK